MKKITTILVAAFGCLTSKTFNQSRKEVVAFTLDILEYYLKKQVE